MYGDTEAIRSQARNVRRQGVELRDQGDRLIARVADAPWHGLAAQAMRARMSVRLADLDHAADLLDIAADLLDAHAEAVDRLRALISCIEAHVSGLVAGAKDVFDLPPLGHRAWLDVRLGDLELPDFADLAGLSGLLGRVA